MRQREEIELLKGRITVIFVLILLAFGVLALGFWNHQIAQSPRYRLLAERNRIRDIPLAAPRGRILDREHRVIADSRPSYNLVLTRENSRRDPEQTIAILASGIEASERELLEWFELHRDEPEYKPTLLKEDLSLADIAYVKAVSGGKGGSYALHSADGNEIARFADREVAFAACRQHDLEPVSVH